MTLLFLAIKGVPDSMDAPSRIAFALTQNTSVESISLGTFDADGVFRITAYFNDPDFTPDQRIMVLRGLEVRLRKRFNLPGLTIEADEGPR